MDMMDDTENMVVDAGGDKNQSTNRRLSGPINSSAGSGSSAKYGNNCPGFKPTAVMRRSFRIDPMNSNNNNNNNTNAANNSNNNNNGQNCNHNERWTMVGTETAAVAVATTDNPNAGDEGDSEVERFNFEGIQISYSSPSLMDMRSVSPPAAKLFRRPLKHHNHQRMQRLQRPCLDFDKMQQVNIEINNKRKWTIENYSPFCFIPAEDPPRGDHWRQQWRRQWRSRWWRWRLAAQQRGGNVCFLLVILFVGFVVL